MNTLRMPYGRPRAGPNGSDASSPGRRPRAAGYYGSLGVRIRRLLTGNGSCYHSRLLIPTNNVLTFHS